MPDLSRKSDRKKLGVRHDPYWQRLAEGAYLGFRRGPETWLARYRGRDRRQQYATLGEALEFDDAKVKAEAWLSQMTGSAVRAPKRDTVRAALETYVKALQDGRPEAAREAEARFKLTVYKSAIADLSLDRATKDDFREWRDRLKEGRQPRSVNRHVRSVVAGLNYAHAEHGHVGDATTWQLKPLADTTADESETAVFLTPAQRKALISAATLFAAAFL